MTRLATIGLTAMMSEPDSEAPSADDILDVLQEIILTGLAVSAAFSGPVRAPECMGLAPFALRAIHTAGRRGLSQAELARALNRSAPWTTRLIDHLEHDGLVSRTPHPSDRRVNMLVLLPLGAEALEGFIARGRTAVLTLFPVWTRSASDDFQSQLRHIREVVDVCNHPDV